MKTTAEIDALKANWLGDPCYDLADVEGFEAHADELGAFQAEQEAAWEAKRIARVNARCAELGCTPAMLIVIERLEAQIERQQEEIEKLQDEVSALRFINRRAA